MSGRPRPLRLIFVSSNGTSWGGSEELWGKTAIHLARDGHRVLVIKPTLDRRQPRVRELLDAGCRLFDLGRARWIPARIYGAVATAFPLALWAQRVFGLALRLYFAKSDLIVFSQGGNFDGVTLANVVRHLHRPYVLISQKAGELYWPSDRALPRMRLVYAAAKAVYFVSEHNRRLTEEQIGLALPNASVVRNPFLVPWEPRGDWPSEERGLHLACIGRLFPLEKGQDLVLRVLSREKWRERPLRVTFYGVGNYGETLRVMARYLGLEPRVAFAGHLADPARIWDECHGLFLPSRCEGLPLVVVEAMLCGRVPIVTNIGGNPEVIRDNVTGFLAATPTEDDVDEALERAWQRRAEWRAIGAAAATEIRTLVPEDPARELGDAIVQIAMQLAVESEDLAPRRSDVA